MGCCSSKVSILDGFAREHVNPFITKSDNFINLY